MERNARRRCGASAGAERAPLMAARSTAWPERDEENGATEQPSNSDAL